MVCTEFKKVKNERHKEKAEYSANISKHTNKSQIKNNLKMTQFTIRIKVKKSHIEEIADTLLQLSLDHPKVIKEIQRHEVKIYWGKKGWRKAVMVKYSNGERFVTYENNETFEVKIVKSKVFSKRSMITDRYLKSVDFPEFKHLPVYII